jgi:hypothetical protein
MHVWDGYSCQSPLRLAAVAKKRKGVGLPGEGTGLLIPSADATCCRVSDLRGIMAQLWPVAR